MIHGPSPVVLMDEQRKCGRCVKRPMKTRLDKYDHSAKNAETINLIRHNKVENLLKPKFMKSAYLQVTVVPAVVPKTAETVLKEHQKRLKHRAEMQNMKRKRECRLMEICRDYNLPRPYYYSPFCKNPEWLSHRRQGMMEYLHDVQAVLQSFERRDNLKTLEQMKTKEDSLYRTTKKAAWRVLYIRHDAPLCLDLLPDQNAAASYRKFLKDVVSLVGSRPAILSGDDCSPSYTTVPRAAGLQRRRSTKTYKAEKYLLRGYRHERKHRYCVPYMVKATVRMNQILYPRRTAKRNFTIVKRLRTAITLRKLFYKHSSEFRWYFKNLLLEHSIDVQSNKLNRKWKDFLRTGDPPQKVPDMLALASFVSSKTDDGETGGIRKKHSCSKCQRKDMTKGQERFQQRQQPCVEKSVTIPSDIPQESDTDTDGRCFMKDSEESGDDKRYSRNKKPTSRRISNKKQNRAREPKTQLPLDSDTDTGTRFYKESEDSEEEKHFTTKTNLPKYHKTTGKRMSDKRSSKTNKKKCDKAYPSRDDDQIVTQVSISEKNELVGSKQNQ